MGKEDETSGMKIKDLFETGPLLTGRTQIDTQNKLNIGLIYSIPGLAFNALNPDIDDIRYGPNAGGSVQTTGAGIFLVAPVNLPNGAKVTSAIVYGNTTTETWELTRCLLTNAATVEVLASATVETEDTSISNDIIDNSTYSYYLIVNDLDASDKIDGAKIKYEI